MPLTTFPIATALLSDVAAEELPNYGRVTENVASYATGGDGSVADPWTGWDGPFATAMDNLAGNCTFVFPSGTYSYSSTLNWGKYPNVHYKGERGTVLKYTGSGSAVKFLATSVTTHSTLVMTFGNIFENFTIDGTGTGTVGLDLQSIHFSQFRNIMIRNVLTYGVRHIYNICDIFDNITVSPSVGNEDGDGNSDLNVPNIGFYSEAGSIVGAGAFQTLQACTWINPCVEVCASHGAHFTSLQQCTFIGGTFEVNGGANVLLQGAGCEGNTFIGVDNEYSGINVDFHLSGNYNRLINCLGTGIVKVDDYNNLGSEPTGNEIIGGRYSTVYIDIRASETVVDGPWYGFLAGGGFFNGSATTRFRRPARSISSSEYKGYDLSTINEFVAGNDIYIPDSTKGIVLRSPDGTWYRLTAANGGSAVFTSTTAPEEYPQSDAFTDNAMGKQWKLGTFFTHSTATTVSEASATLRITPPNSVSGNTFNGYFGTARTMADGGYERIHYISRPTTGLASLRFGISIGVPNSFLSLYVDNSVLTLLGVSGGSGSVIASIAFNPATMVYWRFLRAGANFTAQYSTDGSAWTDLGTSAGAPWGTSSDPYNVAIEAGSTGSATFDAPVVFDDYLRG